MHSSTRAWLVRKVQFSTTSRLPNSGNVLLVFRCGRSVQNRHRTSAAEGGQLSGATGGARAPARHHPDRAHDARSAAHPAEAAGVPPEPATAVAGRGGMSGVAIVR